MAEIVLNEDCLRLMSQFESITGAGSRDCIIDDRNERLIFVINQGEMGRAIGKQGMSIKNASDVMGKRIEVVEYSGDPEQFIRNCFLPAQVKSIEIRPNEDTGDLIAYVDVREEDRGIAIGKAGKNIFKAKRLAQRQHDVADILLLQDEE
ncbi:MAG: NusA-like transcription termination signal-binding factor [Methanomicrobiaceae archaeon]|nr:NusA-like transcription termination signal-binding factor [Methanomicrobiaceae archaeon]